MLPRCSMSVPNLSSCFFTEPSNYWKMEPPVTPKVNRTQIGTSIKQSTKIIVNLPFSYFSASINNGTIFKRFLYWWDEMLHCGWPDHCHNRQRHWLQLFWQILPEGNCLCKSITSWFTVIISQLCTTIIDFFLTTKPFNISNLQQLCTLENPLNLASHNQIL